MHSSDAGSSLFDDTDDEYVQVTMRPRELDLFERLGTRIGPVRDAAIAARLRILQQAMNEERFWDENEELLF
jgi:predicted ArsR family transcriptional regulator